MSASVSASVLATIAPKLHSQIKLHSDMLSHNSLDVQVNPMLNAFAGAFASHSNDHSTRITYGVPPLLVLLMGMMMSGQGYMAAGLALPIVLVGIVVGWLTISLYGVECGPPPHVSVAVSEMPASEGEKLQRVMKGFLGLSNKFSKKVENEGDCVAMTQYITSAVHFHIKYARVMDYVVSETMRVQAESLNDEMQEHNQTWCESFKALNALLSKGPQKLLNLCDMHRSSSKRREPIEEKKIKRIVDVSKVEEAVEKLASKDSEKLIKKSREFLKLVQRGNPATKYLEKDFEEHERLDQEKIEQRKKVHDCKEEIAETRGLIAGLSKKVEQCSEARSGSGSHTKYLEHSLTDVQNKLDKAVADEKSFTWWMFGSRVYMYQNDVALAKEKIANYTRQQEELERRIASLKNGSDDAIKIMHMEAEKSAKDLKTAQERLGNQDIKLAQEQRELSDLETNIKDCLTRINKKLVDENRASVKHMLEASIAINSFAQQAVSAASVARTGSRGWKDTFAQIKDIVEYIEDAEDFKEQETLVYKFKKIIEADQVPAWQFIRESRPPMTLIPPDVDKPSCVFAATADDVLSVEDSPLAAP